MDDYKNIEAEQVERQIADAASIYLFEGWYFIADLEKMIDEAKQGKRVIKYGENNESN